MPGFNRTGPTGAGPLTGGGRGPCNSEDSRYDRRFTDTRDYGRGLGLRRSFRGGFNCGRGRGFRSDFRWYPAAGRPTYAVQVLEESEMLSAEAGDLQRRLEAINKRIAELDKKT